ncbi:MAG: hypothetical protein ACI4OX_01310 [Akkermansia sp.]
MRHLLAAIALLALGCAAGEDSPAVGSAEASAAMYTALVKQAGSVAKQLRAALEGVRDATGAEAAAPGIKALAEQSAAVDVDYLALPEPAQSVLEFLTSLPEQQNIEADWTAINARLLALAESEPPYYGSTALREAVQSLPCVSVADRKNTILAMHAAARELTAVLQAVTDSESAEASVSLVSLLIERGLELESEYASYPVADDATAETISRYLEALSYASTMETLGAAAAALLALPTPCYGCTDLADLLADICGS